MLSQWRSYCPSVGGYAIGFDRSYFEKLKGNSEFSPRIFECVYDEIEKDRLARTFGEDLILGHYRIENFTKDKRSVFQNTIYYWLMYVIECKNTNFKEEDEVRFATYIQNDLNEIDIVNMPHASASTAYYPQGIKVFQNRKISFRPKENILVPFLEYDFDINAM